MDPPKVLAIALIIVGLSVPLFGIDSCSNESTGISGMDLNCFFGYSMASFALLLLGIIIALVAMKKGREEKKGKEILLPFKRKEKVWGQF